MAKQERAVPLWSVLVVALLCGTASAQANPPGWQVYRDAKRGFTIAYPKDFKSRPVVPEGTASEHCVSTLRDENTIACFQINPDPYFGTNFQDAGVTVKVLPDVETAEGCRKIDTGSYPVKQTIIHGVNFYYGEVGDVAAGTIGAGTEYRAFHEGVCIALDATIVYSSMGAYDPGTINEFDWPPLQKKLRAMVRTFRFVARPASAK